MSEGSKLYDFYGNEASAMLSSIGKSVNRYATKYEDKFNVQPDDIFSFTLPSNPITLPRLEAARNGLDTSVILTKLEQIKKENPEQFNAIEPLVGVDQ